MTKKWIFQSPRPDLADRISKALNISNMMSQFLVNRGIETEDQADIFMHCRLSDLGDPFIMKDMERAVEKIVSAITDREKIIVFGDYDVDGITATALLVLFLKAAGAEVDYYIPERIKEGYGLSIEALKKFKAKNVSLVITVDCGISDFEEAKYAKNNNIDLIITDHHEVTHETPFAHAILDPKQHDCKYPFKWFAGVGIAFKLVMALRKTLRQNGWWNGNRQEPNLKAYLDLVSLGTIADVVPLLGENRILVKNGLEVIGQSKRYGIKALKKLSGINGGETNSEMVAFRLAPRMNASGRIASAENVIRLMLCTDPDEAERIAGLVDRDNTERQKIGRKILKEAREMILQQADTRNPIVLSSAGWHPGVLGICASRLCDEFCKPALLFSVDSKIGEARGSARTIEGFDILGAILQCESYLKSFGGHKSAAGLTLSVNNYDGFKEEFIKISNGLLAEKDFVSTINIDAKIDLSQISYGFLEELKMLSPFGNANPEPVLSADNIDDYSSMIVGNGHLKLKIRDKGKFYDAIGFNMGEDFSFSDEKINIAFVPKYNYFNGTKNIQLNLKALRQEED